MRNAIDADIAYLKIRAHQEHRREKASDPYGPAMSLYARTTGDTHYPPEIFDKIKKSIDAGFSPEQAVQSVQMTRASAAPTTPRTMHTVSNFSARLAAGTATNEEIGEVHDALQAMNDTTNVQLTDSEMSKAQKLVKTLDNVIKNDFPGGKGPSVSSPEYKRFTELHGIRNELDEVLGKRYASSRQIPLDTSEEQEPGTVQQRGNRWHTVNQDGEEGDFSSEDLARKFASSGVTTETRTPDRPGGDKTYTAVVHTQVSSSLIADPMSAQGIANKMGREKYGDSFTRATLEEEVIGPSGKSKWTVLFNVEDTFEITGAPSEIQNEAEKRARKYGEDSFQQVTLENERDALGTSDDLKIDREDVKKFRDPAVFNKWADDVLAQLRDYDSTQDTIRAAAIADQGLYQIRQDHGKTWSDSEKAKLEQLSHAAEKIYNAHPKKNDKQDDEFYIRRYSGGVVAYTGEFQKIKPGEEGNILLSNARLHESRGERLSKEEQAAIDEFENRPAKARSFDVRKGVGGGFSSVSSN